MLGYLQLYAYVRFRLADCSVQGDFTDTEWQAISSNNVVNWELSANDGEKRLYARVQDKAGNISNAVSSDFTLDLTPPLGGIEANPYVVGVNTDAVTIYLTDYDNQTSVTAIEQHRSAAALW